jgi:simple sugar transport system permease protein
MRLLRTPEAALAAVLVVAALLIGAANPAFWGWGNLFGLLRSASVTGIMALGVLLVLVAGGIDVSFPAFAAVAMYLSVRAVADWGWPSGAAAMFLVAAGIGLLLGAVNALFVHSVRLVPLIVTLGTGAVARGFLLGVVGTSVVNVGRMPPEAIAFGRLTLIGWEADGNQIQLSVAVLVWAVTAVLVHLLLRLTVPGRGLYALGGDAEAAKRVGFDVRGLTYLAYGLAGALAGVAGMLHACLAWQASPREFIGLELDVLAAVVLGGASIFGGRGSVPGTVLGVLLLVLVNNSLILLGVPTTWQRVVVGAILVGAAGVTAMRERGRRPAASITVEA